MYANSFLGDTSEQEQGREGDIRRCPQPMFLEILGNSFVSTRNVPDLKCVPQTEA